MLERSAAEVVPGYDDGNSSAWGPRPSYSHVTSLNAGSGTDALHGPDSADSVLEGR